MSSIGTGIEAYINISSGGQAVKKVKDIEETEYTLKAEDVDFVLQFRADANIKVLVPAGLPEDGRYEGKQLGDGMIALDNDEGVTIDGTDFTTYAARVKYSQFTLDWTSDEAYVVNVRSATLKANIAATVKTGSAVNFLEDSVYGSIASPITGNITSDVTGANLGVTNIMIHNSGTAPTFDSKFKKLNTSLDYQPGVNNFIYMTYINSTTITYSIRQIA